MTNLPDQPLDSSKIKIAKATDDDMDHITLKISNADTDEKFENCLKHYLSPLLGELANSTESIRKKVLELLTHVNRRLRCRGQIQIPVVALLHQYSDPTESFFVTNFAHIYIKMGYPRMPKEDKILHMPLLFACLREDKPMVQRDTLLHLTLPLLNDVKITDSNRKEFEMRNLKEERRYAIKFYTLVLMVPYNFQKMVKQEEESSLVPVPEGLSVFDYTRVMGDSCCVINTADDLEKTKVGIMNFLNKRLYPPEDSIVAVIVANSDSRHSVVSLADKEVRNLSMQVDWEKEDLLNDLLDLYLARRSDTDAVKNRNDAIRCPPSVTLRLKLAPYLMRSKITLPNQMTACLLDVAFDAVEDVGHSNNKKLMGVGFDLLTHLATYCTTLNSHLAIGTIARLMKFLKTKTVTPEEINLKVKGYNVFGMVIAKEPIILLKDLNVLTMLFEMLALENPPDVKTSVFHCLNRIASVYKEAKKTYGELLNKSMNALEALLFENIEKSDPMQRQAAVHFAGEIYPADHISTRYLILQALGDEDDRVRSEAKNAFSQFQEPTILSDIVDGKVKLPPFVDFVNHDTQHARRNPFVDVDRLIPVVEFIRLCLLATRSGLTEAQLAMPYESDEDFRFRISRNVRFFMAPGDRDMKRGVDTYFRLIQVVIFTKTSHTPAEFPRYLEEVLVGNTTELLVNGKQLFERMNSMLLVTQRGANCRHACASVYSLVTMETETPETVLKVAGDIVARLSPAQAGQTTDHHLLQGLALGAAFLIERLVVKQKAVQGKGKVNVLSLVNLLVGKLDGYLVAPSSISGGSGSTAISNQSSSDLTQSITVLLDSLTALAQCGALAHLSPGKMGSEAAWASKAGLLRRLSAYLKSNQSPIKVKEATLRTMAALMMAESNFPHSVSLLEALVDTHATKDIEFHLLVGQTLVNVLLGPSSPYRGQWYERHYPPNPQPKKAGQKEVKWLLTRIHDLLAHSSPIARQAAAAWVLMILRRMGVHQDMHLSNLQTQLMCLLGDRDETTQDVASQCLSLLFDLCPPDNKDNLVTEMIDVVMNGKRRKMDMTDETQVFAEGEVRTEDGSLTTYKELCSLASSLNQPDLVYSFLSLASVQSEWASRRGVATGFAFVARRMGKELEKHLPVLVPKLYRYQFDPHPKIQQSMTKIWQVLAAESSASKLVETYFKEIVVELQTELTSRQQRVREACCWAVKDLLRHRCVDSLLVTDVGTLFTAVFLLMDDTKGVIRKAAESAAMALQKFCVRLCEEPNQRAMVAPLVEAVVPVLVERGIKSGVAEVRALSLETVLALVKSGRTVVRPVLPGLVVAALEALSGLEPAAYSQFSQQMAASPNAASMREQLDACRVANAKMSPMADILSRCVQYVDEETLGRLVVPLAEVIRRGIGLGTKCGTAQLLTQVAVHSGEILLPHTGKLLAALLHGVLDKNKVIQRDMARAIGFLVRYAKDTSVEKLLVRVKGWYFEKEDTPEHHWACTYVFNAVATHAPDVLQAHSATVLPLIFLAKQTDPDAPKDGNVPEEITERRKLWSETWVEASGGDSTMLGRFHREVMALVEECLSSASWTVRVQAALTLVALVQAAGPTTEEGIWAGLMESVTGSLTKTGRMWEGKIYLLKSARVLALRMRKHGAEKMCADKHDELISALSKELKRENETYQCEAFRALAAVCDTFGKDCFSDTFPMLKKMLLKGEEQASLNNREILIESIGLLWPQNSKETQSVHIVDTVLCLTTSMEEGTWKLQLSALNSFKLLFSKLDSCAVEASACKECLSTMLAQWKRAAESVKYQSLRQEVLNSIAAFRPHADLIALCQDTVKRILDMYSKDGVPLLKDQAAEILRAM